MLKKVLGIIAIVFSCIIMGCAIVYFSISYYYSTRFLPGTSVNRTDVSSLSISSADALLSRTPLEYSFDVCSDLKGVLCNVDGKTIDFNASYADGMQDIIDEQNQLTWPVAMFNCEYYHTEPTDYTVMPKYNCNKEKLYRQLVQNGLFFLSDTNVNADVHIEQEYIRYALVDSTNPILDKEAVTDYIFDCVCQRAPMADVSSLYSKQEYTNIQKRVLDLYRKINDFQNTQIDIEDDGITYSVNLTKTSKWFVLDENGTPTLDEDGNVCIDMTAVNQTIDEISDAFDTFGKDLAWTRQDGTEVMLPYCLDGYQIDKTAMRNEILDDLYAGVSKTIKPVYLTEGKGHGKDAVGDTYIEVDMGNQKLYYYVNGKEKLSCDVVTGNINRGNGTPAKICDIYSKGLNKTLRGENYETFVYYWMAVSGNIGLHDATWRRKFGEEIYKTNGSHGCVNMPKDKVAELYDMAAVGTPVILYY